MRLSRHVTIKLHFSALFQVNMKDITERLKGKKITLTPQRMAVAEYLSECDDHPTADQIHKAIKEKYPSISLATIYSTLELLKEHGQIQELSIRKRGKACFDPNPDIHHHFLCRKCGKIVGLEFDYPQSCPIIAKDTVEGCKIEEMQAYLYGICSDCLSSACDQEGAECSANQRKEIKNERKNRSRSG